METDYRFKLFGTRDRPLRAFFFCGEEVLDEYLRTRARREMDHRIAVVYVLYDAAEERIAGYYTLSSLSIELPEEMRRTLPRYPEYPATRFLIGKAARFRTHGGGEAGEDQGVDLVGLGEANGGLEHRKSLP